MRQYYKDLIVIFSMLGLTFMSQSSFAISLGGIAHNLLEPTSGITNLMYGVSYVAGGLMLIMALLQYKAHRDNPSQVRLGTPVALLIFAIVFICIPIVSRHSASSEAAHGPIDTSDPNNAPLTFGREQSGTRPHRENQQQPTRPQQPVQREQTPTVPVHQDDSDWY